VLAAEALVMFAVCVASLAAFQVAARVGGLFRGLLGAEVASVLAGQLVAVGVAAALVDVWGPSFDPQQVVARDEAW
jgi:hypothetical protein